MNLPELGVGITYFPGLEPVVDRHAGFIQVLEIEPQTFWTRSRSGELRIQESTLEQVRSFPSSKLVHGVGAPVGGTLPPHSAHTEPMRRTIEILSPAWVSEHLSFNRIKEGTDEHETLFLLPPRQTIEGVRAAVRSIRAMAHALGMPIAVETAVSYMRPRQDEMADGEFFRTVVECADCGIVLDLHNLWVNQRNGRQSVQDFLDQIQLDRVWEVHVAGGEEMRGFWLDAHSGPMQAEFYELAQRIVPLLPNLRALIFEMFPSYLPRVGDGFFRQELERLHRLWDLRGTACKRNGPSAFEWESALGRVALKRTPRNELERELAEEPGVAVMQELIDEFRAGYVLSALRLSSRLLLLALGDDGFRALLAKFWAVSMPQSFASQEGEAFARFLKEQILDIPYLPEVIEFDLALLATQMDNEPKLVRFTVAPLPMLRALGEGRMPTEFEEGEYELVVTPDSR